MKHSLYQDFRPPHTFFAAGCCCPLVAVQLQDSFQVGGEPDDLFCPYFCSFFGDPHCPPEQWEVGPGSSRSGCQSSVKWMACLSLSISLPDI